MKDKKSFKELVREMQSLQEDQQGKLKGGFSSYSATNSAAYKQISNAVAVAVTVSGDCGCTCACEEENS